jgi:Arc/MetJ family transcription regulator
MRTTLNIDDDVLKAAREIGRREKKTAGQVVSALARTALIGLDKGAAAGEPRDVFGFQPFPSRGRPVTNELIDSLREGDAY